MLRFIDTATVFCFSASLGGCLPKDDHPVDVKTVREPVPRSDMRAPDDSKCRGRPIERFWVRGVSSRPVLRSKSLVAPMTPTMPRSVTANATSFA